MTLYATSTADAEQPREITLNVLPLELLDIVLEAALLHWILDSSARQRNEDVIRVLASIDFCWFQRITRRKFKNRIWQRLRGFYGKTRKAFAIVRNNRNYFLENVRPTDELIASLLASNSRCSCLTLEQSQFIQRKRSTRDKNAELLHVMRSFSETRFSNFVKCMRLSGHKSVARIIENGGGVFKIEVQNGDTQRINEKIEDLQNRTKPRSRQTERLVGQLKEKDIEILNSQLDRTAVVVWIWCRTERGLNHFQKLYESNQLAEAFTEILNIRPSKCRSTSETFKSKVLINMDRQQMETTIVVCTVSINFSKRLNVEEDEAVWAMTKLRNELCVLCLSKSFSSHAICFFEDRNPFRLRKKIEIKELVNPWDIEASEKDNCLYVSDYHEKCIWKIAKETAESQYKVIQWLVTSFQPQRISVAADGRFLLVNYSESVLMIYGSDAELLRFISLPKDINKPRHVLETAIGNLIVLHEWETLQAENEERNGRTREWIWVVSELSRDHLEVVRRFIPSREAEKLNEPLYLSLDSDDQVFVVDKGNERVILLDSNLKWDRTLCPREADELKIRQPRKFCFDDDNKQLIIVGDFYLEDGVNIYSLNRV